jgi:hypothetical protein
MSVLLLKVAVTAFFLFLFFTIVAVLFGDVERIVYDEFEQLSPINKVMIYILVGLGMCVVTGVLGSMIAKIWGY